MEVNTGDHYILLSTMSLPAIQNFLFLIPRPAHFLRNQQNLLGEAGLVKPSTITHIHGTSFNPIVVDDEDIPILGWQFKDSRHHFSDPSVLAAPTNEDIVSVLIGQKDISCSR
jgi:hypothetical protein